MRRGTTKERALLLLVLMNLGPHLLISPIMWRYSRKKVEKLQRTNSSNILPPAMRVTVDVDAVMRNARIERSMVLLNTPLSPLRDNDNLMAGSTGKSVYNGSGTMWREGSTMLKMSKMYIKKFTISFKGSHIFIPPNDSLCMRNGSRLLNDSRSSRSPSSSRPMVGASEARKRKLK
ncbi:MAG: hypothetical protein QXW76_05200 [Candidatus Korarchaeum sp.]